MKAKPQGHYDLLFPEIISGAVEEAYSLSIDGLITPFPSYINRVYGIQDGNGNKYAVKYYRPGRWTREAILEEHQLLFDCDESEIPVVAPIRDNDGESLSELSLEHEEALYSFFFALFPLKAGRNFDAEADSDWLKLGRLVGRVHEAGRRRKSIHRLECLPEKTTIPYLAELEDTGLVSIDERDEFFTLLRHGLELITPMFSGVSCQRIHADCHRGNILDRGPEGLLLFDFDDMMSGPPVQDFWLLLPDHANKCQMEINLLLEGYEQFSSFDYRTLRLIEPLRLMRMVYFLLWCARQKNDFDFSRHFPAWGTRAFWIKEIEDFKYQISIIENNK
ncbi:MAG: serine/threonine protein kinase [Spirochaetaceae bacterium]|nr:MAG: serine/threonine protein kinase [Spirochaetaceae bacterium]